MNDSSAVRLLLESVLPKLPRDHELMSLHDLAVYVQICRDMDAFPAQIRMLAELLGDGEFQGRAPAFLHVYRRFVSGPVRLEPVGSEFAGFRYPAPRLVALGRLPAQLHMHGTIDQIPAGYRDDEPAGRFLAVVRADALRAFGFQSTHWTDAARTGGELMAELLTPSEYASICGHLPPDKDSHRREPGKASQPTAPAAGQSVPAPVRPDDASIFGEVKVLRDARQRRTTAAVAEKYGVSIDTIQRACRAHTKANRPACSVFDQPRKGTPKAQ